MILIISVNHDFTTTHVMRWLNLMGQDFIRLNEEDGVLIHRIDESGFVLKTKERIISLGTIKSVWYRRGNLKITVDAPRNSKEKTNSATGYFSDYNKRENKELITYVHSLLKEKKCLNDFENSQVNKLKILRYGKQNGLRMPRFIITQKKSVLYDFYNKCQESLISKPIKTVFNLKNGEELFSSYSYKIQDRDLKNLPQNFTPTFFQEYIKKLFEIRVFYLDGDFYSMAIFSQNNPRTKVDFRKYDQKKPNRITPYKFDEIYAEQIRKMMNFLNINCASIDIAVSKKWRYYLLDVNPIGQFGMTSKPCNYFLEKKVAEYLSN